MPDWISVSAGLVAIAEPEHSAGGMRSLVASLFFGLLGMARPTAVVAQATGYQIIFPEVSAIYRDGSPIAMAGLGMDHDFHDKLSWGLDLTYGFGLFERYETVRLMVEGEEIRFGRSPHVLSLIYHSSYFFNSTEEWSLFAGTSIGARKVFDHIFDGQPTIGYGQAGITDQRASLWLVPVGIHGGVRSALHFFYLDMRIGVNAHIGDTDLYDGLPVVSGASAVNRYYWSASLSVYGLGW